MLIVLPTGAVMFASFVIAQSTGVVQLPQELISPSVNITTQSGLMLFLLK